MPAATQARDHRHQDADTGHPNAGRPNSAHPETTQVLLRTSDVAALFQVSTRTVSEWARQGRVPCMRTPGGQWRYPAEPIRQLVDGLVDRPNP